MEAPPEPSYSDGGVVTNADAGQRRFAASMIVHALRSLQPLFNSVRTDAQYFEAVESLVWLLSPGSDFYFEILGFDPDVARKRVDLSLYAEFAHTVYEQHREFMLNMYIAMARYSLQEKQRREGGPKAPYKKLVRFAEDALAYTTFVLDECRSNAPKEKPGVREGRLPSFLASLSELAEA